MEKKKKKRICILVSAGVFAVLLFLALYFGIKSLDKEEEAKPKIAASRFKSTCPDNPDTPQTAPYPWQVQLLSAADPRMHCGGIILDDEHVLTSARCVPASQVSPEGYLNAELYKVSVPLPFNQHKVLKVAKGLVHRGFRFLNTHSMEDLAVLRLSSSMKDLAGWGKSLSPACLNDIEKETPQDCQVYGKGRANAVEKGNKTALGRWKVRLDDDQSCELDEPEAVYCSGRTYPSDAFPDLGDPLVCSLPGDSNLKLVGVVATHYSNQPCDGLCPIFYSNMTLFSGWVRFVALPSLDQEARVRGWQDCRRQQCLAVALREEKSQIFDTADGSFLCQMFVHYDFCIHQRLTPEVCERTSVPHHRLSKSTSVAYTRERLLEAFACFTKHLEEEKNTSKEKVKPCKM